MGANDGELYNATGRRLLTKCVLFGCLKVSSSRRLIEGRRNGPRVTTKCGGRDTTFFGLTRDNPCIILMVSSEPINISVRRAGHVDCGITGHVVQGTRLSELRNFRGRSSTFRVRLTGC